jgi:Calcineurin-like phosphoesterase/Secretion system C-terminal sorting domain
MKKMTTVFSKLFLLAALISGFQGWCQNKSIILGRPTNQSITASVLFDLPVEFYLEYGDHPNVFDHSSATMNNVPNRPDEVDIQGLAANTKYYYRLRHRTGTSGPFFVSPQYTFRTQRAPGSGFRFNVEADEHLYDKKGVRTMYKVTLANQAKDSADFMLSLGDIFGDDHTPLSTTSADMDVLHKDYLQYLTEVCHSVPFYVCLGNHEGESGYYLNQTPPENIAVYGTNWRKYYYPNPFPNGFYTGNTTIEPYGIGLPENYYAWTWGDALFVVLDVYRDCSINDKPQNWDWTLGFSQYSWLKTTLQNSNAKFKFVFAHHTRGQGRGGIKTAKGCEWGGYSGANNTNYQFDAYRPGWGLPIHQLMKSTGVNIFFQGHDHLFAKETLDSLVYQEVPMPADSTYEIGMLANADAYTDVKLSGTGHLRVTVEENCVTVDFIRAYLPQDTTGGLHHNGEIAYSYTVGPCTQTAVTDKITSESSIALYPSPAENFVNLTVLKPSDQDQKFELVDLQGQIQTTQILPSGSTTCRLDVVHLPKGVYAVRWLDGNASVRVKMLVIK